MPLPLHSLREQYGSDCGVMSYDGCSHCETLIDCWATAPGYVTFISDLLYGMPLVLFVSQILSFIIGAFRCSIDGSMSALGLCTYHECCIISNSCSADSVSVSQGFLRFASLCGVVP